MNVGHDLLTSHVMAVRGHPVLMVFVSINPLIYKQCVYHALSLVGLSFPSLMDYQSDFVPQLSECTRSGQKHKLRTMCRNV